MALYFEPQNQQPGLGSALAEGIGGAIGGLLEGKIGQMQRQSLEQSLASSGIKPEMASAIARIGDPKLQQLLLKEAIEAPYNEAFAQSLGGGAQMGLGSQGSSGIPAKLRKDDALKLAGLDLQRQQLEQRREAQFEKNPRFAQIRTRASIVPEIKKDVQSALDTLKQTSLTGPLSGKFSWATPDGQKLKAKLDSVAIQKYLTQLTPGSKGSIALLELIQASKANTKMNYKTIESLLNDVFEDANRYGYEQQALNFAIEDGYSQAKANDLVDNVARISKRLPAPNDTDEDGQPYEDGAEIEDRGYLFQKIDGEWIFKGKE